MRRIGLTLALILALEPNTAAAQQATTVYARANRGPSTICLL